MEGINVKDIVNSVHKTVNRNFSKIEEALSDRDKKVFDASVRNFAENKVKSFLSSDESEKYNYDYLASVSLVGLDIILSETDRVSIQSGLKTAFELLGVLVEKGLAPAKTEEM